jgi:hypothetical protein
MTAIALLIAGLAIGVFTGGFLMASYTATKITRVQERSQRIVRYWQAEERHWHAIADYYQRGKWPDTGNPPLDQWGG